MNTKKSVLFVKFGSNPLAFVQFSGKDLLPNKPIIKFNDMDDLQPLGNVASLKL